MYEIARTYRGLGIKAYRVSMPFGPSGLFYFANEGIALCPIDQPPEDYTPLHRR